VPFAAAKLLADRGSLVIDQLTFADFLRRGSSIATCAGCARSITSAATRSSPSSAGGCLRPSGVAAGLHLVVWLPDDLPEAALLAAAHARGPAIAGVAPYRLAPASPGGLIFGYSDLSTSAIRRGVRLLETAIEDVSGTAG
jgi:GntR family transcriptional regulator/MocR family aminotransferase